MNDLKFALRQLRKNAGLAAVAALTLIACDAGVAKAAAVHGNAQGPDFSKLEAGIERLRLRWNVPGIAAGVALSNQIVWTKGFGQADLTTKQPVTPNTVFHLASLTKPFAAVVLLQLVEAGQLDLGHDEKVMRSPFANEFLRGIGL